MRRSQPNTIAVNKNDPNSLSGVTPNNDENKHYRRTRLPPPPPPVVAAALLGGEQLTFVEFLLDAQCAAHLSLFFGEGRDSSAATMVEDFRKATEFHYFGHRPTKHVCRPPKNPGLLASENSKRRGALTEFARRAYRGDPQRRGQLYWKKIARLLWNTYESLMKSRALTAEIKLSENERIEGLVARREKNAARVRKHRTKKKVPMTSDGPGDA